VGARREVLRASAFLAAGVVVGGTGSAEAAAVADSKLPIYGGAAGATVASRDLHPGRGQALITWAVKTERNLVALTFDDGPRPKWTPVVLDILDEFQVPATFFLVGRRVRQYGQLLRGRMDRHEVGNHTWDHLDLAKRGQDEAYSDVRLAHDAIQEVTRQTPTKLRPPYGHLGGSTALAASRLGYDIVLWSAQMHESQYPNDPSGHAADVVRRVLPGTIMLAHDVGTADRLVAIRGLPDMINGLRARGFEFVTVSQLLTASQR
jgi:peptidoglycan/xylan/chitin deacetylase (PgdA/CDA1 family)